MTRVFLLKQPIVFHVLFESSRFHVMIFSIFLFFLFFRSLNSFAEENAVEDTIFYFSLEFLIHLPKRMLLKMPFITLGRH